MDYLQFQIQQAISLIKEKSYHKAFYQLKRLETSHPFDQSIKSALNKLALVPIEAKAYAKITKLIKTSHIEEGIAFIKALIHENPISSALWSQLGDIYRRGKFPKKAVACFKKALEYDRDNADIQNKLGICYFQLQQPLTALTYLQKSFPYLKNTSETHRIMAMCYLYLDDFKKGMAVVSDILHQNPEDYVAITIKANFYQSINDFQTAIPLYKDAIRLKPGYEDALMNLAMCYEFANQSRDAEAIYQQVMKSHPNNTEAFRRLTIINPDHINASTITSLKSNYENQKMDIKQSVAFFYGLANIKFAKSDLAGGFDDLTRGNSLNKKIYGYSIQNDQDKFKTIKTFFEDHHGKLSSLKAPLETLPHTPIFILGMPRSGTTLIEQTLAKHEKISPLGELPYLGEIIPEMLKQQSIQPAEMFNGIRNRYLEKIDPRPLKEFNIDKTPHNFLYVGFIRHAFPEAKILHIKRSPMAVCWSNYRTNFTASGLGYSNDLNDIAIYYHLYRDLMQFWSERYQDHIKEIVYEDFVDQPEDKKNDIFEYLGLSVPSTKEQETEEGAVVRTASRNQVNKPIYKNSSNQWKKMSDYILPQLETVMRLENE